MGNAGIVGARPEGRKFDMGSAEPASIVLSNESAIRHMKAANLRGRVKFQRPRLVNHVVRLGEVRTHKRDSVEEILDRLGCNAQVYATRLSQAAGRYAQKLASHVHDRASRASKVHSSIGLDEDDSLHLAHGGQEAS